MRIHHYLLGFELLKLRGIRDWFSVDVIFKIAFFDSSIRKLHLAHAVLNTMLPLSLVAAAISPVHLSVSVSFIVFVAAFVHVSTFPGESPKSVFLIVDVLSFIVVAVGRIRTFFPFTMSVFHSVFELAYIDGGVFPFVLARSTRLTIHILTYVRISVCKNVRSLTVLQTKLPLAFVSVTVFPLMHAIPISFALGPLAYV